MKTTPQMPVSKCSVGVGCVLEKSAMLKGNTCAFTFCWCGFHTEKNCSIYRWSMNTDPKSVRDRPA